MQKIVKCGHDYVAQVKSNQKELLKWVTFNTALKDVKPIDSYTRYEHNTHGRYEERVCEDSSRIRTDQAPLVFTMLRSLAINIMNVNNISNIKKARKLFGWSPHRFFNLGSGLK